MINKWLYLITLNLIIVSTNITAQTIKDYISINQPDGRYSVHGNGTVTDTYTGLMWKVCSEGQEWSSPATCSGTAASHNWQQALELAGSKSFASFNDWRLPNIDELRSIVAYDRYDPAINLTIFSATPSANYWSSSPYANDSNEAWLVYFDNGNTDFYNRDNKYFVRLVRGGQ